MNCNNTERQVFICDAPKASFLYQFLEAFLIGKIANAFHKIFICLPLSGYQLTHDWNDLERVLVIKPATENVFWIFESIDANN